MFTQLQAAGGRYGHAVQAAIRYFGFQVPDERARILAMANAFGISRDAEAPANEDVMFWFFHESLLCIYPQPVPVPEQPPQPWNSFCIPRGT